MNNISIFLFDINDVSVNTLLNSSFLSPSDIALLEKYKVEEVKKEKVASLIIKKQYIGDYHYNEFGKPISDKAFFNISHSSNVIVFVKSDLEVGIDIEKIKPVEDELIDYISSNEEKRYIKSNKNFFEIWTNKESLAKCIGVGIKNEINNISSLPLDGVKEYKGDYFYSRTVEYQDFIISVTRATKEEFDIAIKESVL